MIRWSICTIVSAALVAGLAQAENKGKEVEIDGLKSRVPETWKAQETNSQFRVAQFTIPKVDGEERDGELVVYFFQKGGGGGVEANLKRWQQQIVPPEGKKIEDVPKKDSFKVGDVQVTQIELQGTYQAPAVGPNQKAEKISNARMIGVIFESPNGPYYFKFVGPAKTIEANKKGFEEWLKNFK
ncbi:MAG TPA: hypothetical protein VGZ47_20620 [Gemmataceae bacterium]|nr:hypothetical protein [Gemmataceae bacterium]